MKLLSLNVEGTRHEDRVAAFIAEESAEVIALQEAHAGHARLLNKQGYWTSFLPRCLKEQEGKKYTDGIILAARYPFSATSHYYYKPTDKPVAEMLDEKTGRKTDWQGFLLAEIQAPNAQYHIGSTHFTWTPDGSVPNQAQQDDMKVFARQVSKLPPHIMCGDFNIPRHHNSLYKELTRLYTDEIPAHYSSSLDRDLHHLGSTRVKDELFTDYMVDYVFSQPPYEVSEVRLAFGVSDHAAVVCEIEKR